jgi:hypothetical protein
LNWISERTRTLMDLIGGDFQYQLYSEDEDEDNIED